jgi:hypothetical protein
MRNGTGSQTRTIKCSCNMVFRGAPKEVNAKFNRHQLRYCVNRTNAIFTLPKFNAQGNPKNGLSETRHGNPILQPRVGRIFNKTGEYIGNVDIQ